MFNRWRGPTKCPAFLSASKIFTAVVDMIAWALHCAGIQNYIHYLDDYLFMGAPLTEKAVRVLSTVLNVLEHLGFPVATNKTEGPPSLV